MRFSHAPPADKSQWTVKNSKQVGAGAGAVKRHRARLGLVLNVAYMRCGRRVVLCSHYAIDILEVTTGQSLSIDSPPLYGAAAVSPNGSEISSATRDFGIQRWDAFTGGPLGRPMQGHADKIWCIAYSPDGTRIVSGSHDRTIRLWDASSGSAVGIPFEGHTSWVTSVAFSPDSRQIASASHDATICIWDSGSGKHLAAWEGHSDAVDSVCCLPDGSFIDPGHREFHIVSGSSDGTVCIWNTTTLQLVRAMRHSNPVLSVVVSPSGKYIASGSNGGIRIWIAETGAPVGDLLTKHTKAVVSVAFSPDGKSIALGCSDLTVRICELFV